MFSVTNSLRTTGQEQLYYQKVFLAFAPLSANAERAMLFTNFGRQIAVHDQENSTDLF